MTNSNMPILWQNCLMQFSTEIGRKAWVWFAETRGEGMQYPADKYAAEIEFLALSIYPMIAKGVSLHAANGLVDSKWSGEDEVIDDLLKFMLVRHANEKLGGNVRPSFLN